MSIIDLSIGKIILKLYEYVHLQFLFLNVYNHTIGEDLLKAFDT